MGGRYPAGTRFAEDGYYPENVDHEDRNKRNNRIGNPLPSTHVLNCDNRGAPSNNTSGTRGVYRKGAKWAAYKQVGAKPRVWLGTFSTYEEARQARLAADQK